MLNMVKVELKLKKNDIYSAEISGHANSKEYGHDIVCASVSVITQTILLGLIDLLDGNIEYKVESGYLYFKIPEDLEPSMFEKVCILTNTLRLGLDNIKENYSSYIYMKKEEV